MGRDAPYAEGLRFDLPSEDTADADEAVVAGDMPAQMKEKLKDMVGDGGSTPR